MKKSALLKISYLAFVSVVAFLTLSLSSGLDNAKPAESIYNLNIKSLDGSAINLNDFKGKKILFVNVASKCGFTPQYADLQKLHEKYKKNLVIIGVPCNQFMNQEPGSNEEIASFCKKNYGVTFLISEKVDVKGKNQHPLYSWLTTKSKNGVLDSSVKWNFQKYLIDENGRLLEMFASNVNPMESKLTSKI